MTRIVRLEEIDGQLIFRVPEDVAARLEMAAGEELIVSNGPTGLVAERRDERKRRQLELMKNILKEDDAVFSALAK